jgi:hypothetical protein
MIPRAASATPKILPPRPVRTDVFIAAMAAAVALRALRDWRLDDLWLRNGANGAGLRVAAFLVRRTFAELGVPLGHCGPQLVGSPRAGMRLADVFTRSSRLAHRVLCDVESRCGLEGLSARVPQPKELAMPGSERE